MTGVYLRCSDARSCLIRNITKVPNQGIISLNNANKNQTDEEIKLRSELLVPIPWDV